MKILQSVKQLKVQVRCVLLLWTDINSVYQELYVGVLQTEEGNEEKGKQKATEISTRMEE